jgi:hypothetical protein
MEPRSSSRADAKKGLAARIARLFRPAQLDAVDPEAWYVVLDTEFHGPLTREHLIEVLAEHVHDEEAPIWSASHAEEWTTMSEVPGLAERVAAARARSRGHDHASHPPELARFAESRSAPPPPISRARSGEVDIGAALRSLAAAGAPVSPALATSAATSPVAPRPARPERTWARTGFALGAVAVAALLAPFVGTDPRPVARPATPARVAVSPASFDGPPATTCIAPPSEHEALVTPIASAPVSVAPVSLASIARTSERRHSTFAPTAPAESTSESAPMTPPPELAADAPPRSLDELLVRAAPPEVESAAPTERSAVLEVPSDADVVRALESVRASVAACTPIHAVAALRLTFHGPSGRVTGVYVDGVFSGTPAGSCIARSVRAARVAPFAQPTFAYSYPYRL